MPYGAPLTVSRVPCTPHRVPDKPTNMPRSEAECIASDLARNDLKAAGSYGAATQHFDLCQQVQRDRTK